MTEYSTKLCEALDKTLEDTVNSKTKLSPIIFSLPGMSGRLGRMMFNNLCENIYNSVGKLNYLEVGTWKGSTILSATYQNQGTFTAIDNFSQFGGPREELLHNQAKFKKQCKFDFIESDCWKVDQTLIPDKVNCYFFDGAHDYQSQRDAITHYETKFDDSFVLLVDDWNDNSGGLRKGTYDGIKEDSKYRSVLHYEIGHDRDSDSNGWWNGFGLFVMEKK